jgi:DNA-binding IclR family transcriptional regulator
VPSIRKSLISLLVDTPMTVEDLAKAIRLPRSTVDYHLKDLIALDALSKLGSTNTYRLKASIEEEIRSIWKQ